MGAQPSAAHSTLCVISPPYNCLPAISPQILGPRKVLIVTYSTNAVAVARKRGAPNSHTYNSLGMKDTQSRVRKDIMQQGDI